MGGKGKGKGTKGKGRKGGAAPGGSQQLFQQAMRLQQDILVQQQMQQQMRGSPSGQDTQWKAKLKDSLLAKGIAETPVYKTSEAKARVHGGFIGTVTVQGKEYTGEGASNKKTAESIAARAALYALFPEEFPKESANSMPSMTPSTAAMSSMSSMPVMPFLCPQSAGGLGQGQKRNRGILNDTKSKLNHSMQVLVQRNAGRTTNESDIRYETAEFGETAPKQYQAIVYLCDVAGDVHFAGELLDSKEKAEDSAAEFAYEYVANLLGQVAEEHLPLPKKPGLQQK